MAAAGPGEVLVSRTVRDLSPAPASPEDRGTHTLKGLSDSWQLYAGPMSEDTVGQDITTDEAATAVTWYDIYQSPEGKRSLRQLPGLCREAVRLVWAAGPRELLVVLAIKTVNVIGLAVVSLLGKGVLDGVIAAGRSGAGPGAGPAPAAAAQPRPAGRARLPLGRRSEHREILAGFTSRHAQSRIIDVAGAVELEAYDSPAFHNQLVRVAGGRSGPGRSSRG